MLIAINFHYLRPEYDAPYPGIHGITPTQFESQLRLLSSAGRFVSAADIKEAIAGGPPLPARAFVVTFDDGLREQSEFAVPVLDRLGIPAIFFTNTKPLETGSVSSVHMTHLLRSQLAPAEFLGQLQDLASGHGVELDAEANSQQAIEHYKYDTHDIARLKYLLNFAMAAELRDRLVADMFARHFGSREQEISSQLYMSRQQLVELAQRGWLGTHAHEHLPLGLLPEAEAERQIAESRRILKAWTGISPYALGYPYGSRAASSPAVAAAAQRHGIEFAFTMERAANADLQAPLHLARFDNNDLPGGKAAGWPLEALFESVDRRTWFLT